MAYKETIRTQIHLSRLRHINVYISNEP